ncbi:Glycosylphosphatidylinositol anchor attachment 1 protein [Phytophthora boehmeriae]|uniref:Glycosylphosphatidylinositol anchor attachment 1 protein n=1 Tax=Phytophthora boehmeriae TaxID=109152 RepID=A0A8T1WIW9_9STRA|nr:Glycosylphosphatidylinositol anchor attachment 1 protein [Phytophthora boehmeriae]
MEARASHQEANSAKSFHKSLVQIPNLPPNGCDTNCSQVVDWIGTQLRGLDRVEAFTQRFQTDTASPLRTNVYGILRASPLADGKEAIVLVTHYRNVGSDSGDCSGLSLGLALLKYLGRAKWLAKDVILLAADDGVLDGSDGYAPGTEAWLQAYHLDPVENGLQGVLPMRAGVIRAAVNLETMYNARGVGAVGIYTAGMNGQLPNLDLVNTAVRSFRQHKIPIVLDRADTEPRDLKSAGGAKSIDFISASSSVLEGAVDKYGPVEFKQKAREYLTNLKGMLHFMTTLASGPSGPHANFISYNIDSITLSLTKQSGSNDQLGVREILRSIEMVFRALSNLEEKLHQSFFLYVLPSTTTFVSIVAGFSGCAEIQGWRKKIATYEHNQQKKLKEKAAKASAAKQGNTIDLQATNPDPADDIPELDSGWRAIKFLTMALLVYGHCVLGILNYPMALFCAIPMAHFARVVPFGTTTPLKNFLNGLWLFLSSPLVLLVLLNLSRFDIMAGLSFAVDSFVHRINLLVLPYVCCVYVAVHTLSLAVWAFPVANVKSTAYPDKQKRKQE